MMLDKDLEFLKKVDDKYLGVLVDVMINYDGGTSKIKAVKEECSKYGTSYQNYLDVIVDAYLNYGKDVLKSIGKGDLKISYRHVLYDVCAELKIKTNNAMTVSEIEGQLLELLKKDVTIDEKVSDMFSGWLLDSLRCQEHPLIAAVMRRYVVPKNIPFWIKTFICGPTNDPVFGWLKDLYDKSRPELKVTIPCTMLIAIYRDIVKH